ncbi:MAG: YwiC-like family protein [Terriglobales bacterium]
MSDLAIRSPHPSRTRLLVFPREHGAWGILFVPLATGAAVGLWLGGTPTPILLLVIAAFALFCLRTPVESLLGSTPMRAQTPDEKRAVAAVIVLFAAIATAALFALLWRGQHRYLLTIGAAAAALFAAQIFVRKLGRGARMASQLIGAAGLTLTAPAAYYVVTGVVDGRAIALWLANTIFAGNQIHFVQMRIRSARLQSRQEKLAQGRAFLVGQIAMIVLLAVAWSFTLLPGLVFAAFIPVLLRGVLWFVRKPEPLAVHRLGLTELAHAIVFGILLILAFGLAWT